jgi:hypothetical protein
LILPRIFLRPLVDRPDRDTMLVSISLAVSFAVSSSERRSGPPATLPPPPGLETGDESSGLLTGVGDLCCRPARWAARARRGVVLRYSVRSRSRRAHLSRRLATSVLSSPWRRSAPPRWDRSRCSASSSRRHSSRFC